MVELLEMRLQMTLKRRWDSRGRLRGASTWKGMGVMTKANEKMA